MFGHGNVCHAAQPCVLRACGLCCGCAGRPSGRSRRRVGSFMATTSTSPGMSSPPVQRGTRLDDPSAFQQQADRSTVAAAT